MSEPVSATPAAPLADGAPTPAPAVIPANGSDSRLPEGVKLKTDMSADIDKYFDSPDANAPAPKPAAQGGPAPIIAPEPIKGSVAAKLAAKNAPAPVVPPVVPPVADPNKPDDVVARAEAEFIKRDAKWKPSEGWTVLKTTLKQETERRTAAEKKAEEAEKRLASPVLAGMSAKEIEELKEREKAASDRLMIVELESHPSYKAQFIAPKNAEIERATELLKVHNVEANIAALVAKPRAELGKAVQELLATVPDFDRVEIAESIRKAHTLDQSAKAALTQSKELRQSLQQQSVDRQRAAFASRWAPVSAAIGEFAQPIETPADATPEQRAADEAYNKDLGALRQKAEAIALSPTSDEAIAENSIKAAAYDLHIQRVLPRVVSEYEQVVSINRGLVAELNALRGRNPNHSMRPAPTGGETPTDPSKMDHRQAADHYFAKP